MKFDSLLGVQTKKEEQIKKLQETIWRLTAPVHVTLNSYKEHERIEGYYEFRDYGHIFQCDRLLKLETAYGRVQLGYNPNRRRSFIFANMKTNLYDTVNSRYQKSMKEYQRRPNRRGRGNMAFVSGRKKDAAVLIEKAENTPWSERAIKHHLHNDNMGAILKTMPFFHAQEERVRLYENREEVRQLQESVRENGLEGRYQENAGLHRRILALGQESELLQSVLYRKDAGKRGFIRKVNYAFDIEKHQMFEYYREKRMAAIKEQVSALAQEPGDAGESIAGQEEKDE